MSDTIKGAIIGGAFTLVAAIIGLQSCESKKEPSESEYTENLASTETKSDNFNETQASESPVNTTDVAEEESTETRSRRVDLFTLPTFIGDSSKFKHRPSGDKDNNGNSYDGGYSLYCTPDSNNIEYVEITYSLEGEYSTLSGEIGLRNQENDNEGASWLEFYGDGNYLGETEHFKAGIKPTEFEISVKGVDELLIVKKSGEVAFLLTKGFYLE